jgi:hypothetical protein
MTLNLCLVKSTVVAALGGLLFGFDIHFGEDHVYPTISGWMMNQLKDVFANKWRD